MKKFLFLTLLSGCALFTPHADALKVSVFPSVTFRNSCYATRPCVQRVVTETPMVEVRRYYDPYTGCEYYEEIPVVRNRVVNYYYPTRCCHTRGTDFQLQFRIH